MNVNTKTIELPYNDFMMVEKNMAKTNVTAIEAFKTKQSVRQTATKLV